MADLNDTAAWPGIRQIETTDPVVGGAPNPDTGGGMSNIPPLQLAQRTRFLRDLAERSDLFAAYGGADNDITLTTGLGLSTVPVGLRLRCRATSVNTGAVTVAVDEMPPVAIKTVTGVDLPAGYIRTEVDTDLVFDGTAWIADRQIERGENANGNYVKWADGTLVMRSTKPKVTGLSLGESERYNSPFFDLPAAKAPGELSCQWSMNPTDQYGNPFGAAISTQFSAGRIGYAVLHGGNSFVTVKEIRDASFLVGTNWY